eukprot:512505_1
MGSQTSEEQKIQRNTPKEYICPVTNKIMAHPVMIPMTGIGIDAHDSDEKVSLKQNKKMVIINRRKDIQKRIELYLDLYTQKKQEQITNDSDIDWKKVFEEIINKLKAIQIKFNSQDT